MSLHVLSAGLLTTVQDAGRPGLRHLGVGRAGALDAWSHALANRLAGNAAGTAALEITLTGPTLRFDAAARIALCGAQLDAAVEGAPGEGVDIPMARPIDLPAGSVLRLGGCRDGARSYLAVEGGIAVPEVLGSAATDLRGGFGGMRGRPLATGDVLPLARRSQRRIDALRIAPWWLDMTPDDAPHSLVRVLPGEPGAPLDPLCARRWRVAAASDRQGLRLSGAVLSQDMLSQGRRERTSEPVLPGTVQLPPDGQPIVLLADAQTHGGYPRIAHAIRADWPKLAQLRPGDSVSFASCTPAQARAALDEQRQRFARIGLALAARG